MERFSFIRNAIDGSVLERDWAQLHQIPEPAFHEEQTSRWIREALTASGFSIRGFGKTGLLAHITGEAPGSAIALRADMDALPFPQRDGAVVCRHACGHDAHCAMVLAAGKYLAALGLTRGTLYLLFQPAEESMNGARETLKCGLPHLDGMLGIHLRPQSEIRLGHATPALLHCASLPVTARFSGKAAHAARPHLGINTISAAARAIAAVDEIRLDTAALWSAKATVIDSHGNPRNVIPELCTVVFDLRAETNAVGVLLSAEVKHAVETAAAAVGCAVSVHQEQGFAPEYNPRLVEICRCAIADILGTADPPYHTPGSEDFHAYSALGNIPTAYIGLGADLEPGLHSPTMHFDHSCMAPGAEILADAALRALQDP